MRTSISVLLPLAILLLLGLQAGAVNLKSGEDVYLGGKETVTDDILAAGQTVTVQPRVDGDVTAAGQNVMVSGPVKDSVTLAGNNVTVTGAVGNDAWIAGNKVLANAAIADNAYLAGSSVLLGKDGSVGTDLLAAGNDVAIIGDVGRDLRAAGNMITIAGTVGRNAYLDAGTRVRLTKTALIKGNLFYESPERLQMDPGAKVEGRIEHKLPPKEKAGFALLSALMWRILWLIAAIVFGAAIVALFPDRANKAAAAIRGSFWLSLLVGLVLLIAVPIAIVIGLITIVGIPLALSVAAVYAILVYAAQVFAGLALGRWVLGRRSEQPAKPFGSMILGLVIIAIALPLLNLIPGVGGLLSGIGSLVVLLAGLGGFAVSWWRDRGVAVV